MPTSSRPRLLVLVGLGLLGVVLGLVGAGVIALERRVGPVVVPWGLILAVVGVACTVRGAAWLVGSRRGAVAVLLGWLVPTIAFSAVNPGGDVVLTDQPRTYVYLLLTFALGVLAASWPLPAGAADLAGPGAVMLEDPDPSSYDDSDLDPLVDEPYPAGADDALAEDGHPDPAAQRD